MEEVTIIIKSSDNVCMLQLYTTSTLLISFPLHFTSYTVLFLGLRSWTGMLCRTYRVGRPYCQWLELLGFFSDTEEYYVRATAVPSNTKGRVYG